VGLVGDTGLGESAGRPFANVADKGTIAGSFAPIGREEDEELGGGAALVFTFGTDFFPAEDKWGLARDAVEERCGMACEEDTIAGTEVVLTIGFTPFAASS